MSTNNSNRGKGRKRRRSRGKRKGRRDSSKSSRGNSRSRSNPTKQKFGGREPTQPAPERTEDLKLEPFDLFCSYYLGITPDNRYKKPNVGVLAQQFGCSPNDIELTLRKHGMDKHTLKSVEYDMSLAQLDVRVAPDGLDKRELARPLFEEFCEVNPHFVALDELDESA